MRDAGRSLFSAYFADDENETLKSVARDPLDSRNTVDFYYKSKEGETLLFARHATSHTPPSEDLDEADRLNPTMTELVDMPEEPDGSES